jgi:hypothetical protein
MTEIAFLLLCHKDPEGIIAQALRLTAAGDRVAIHFDGRAPRADYARLRAALSDNPRVTFAKVRSNCGWGEWSLVKATLSTARAALQAFPDARHFFLLSGDCMPIKTAEHIRQRLEAEPADYIESFDFLTSGWIKTGLREERLIYRHWFNERRHRALFYRSMDLQRRLGLVRKPPAGLQMRIGSQWWCLRRRTVKAVLDLAARRRDLVRFFRTVWIPDECFFQTLVAHLVPEGEIRPWSQTFLMFTEYGMPVTFHDDHHDFLLAQDKFFARKISPDAVTLRQRLGDLFVETGRSFDSDGGGQRQLRFLSARGRDGRRFAPRIWEAESGPGPHQTLFLIACRKWHVAKRLTARLGAQLQIPVVDYPFHELQAPLPDLGGLERSLEKRNRHPASFVRLVMDQLQTDRLVLALDPGSVELIAHLARHRPGVRLLEVDCAFSDADLLGHARRIGLIDARTPASVEAQVAATLRRDIAEDSARLSALGLAAHQRISETAALADNARALARLLDLPGDIAADLAATDPLFTD